MGLTFRVFLVLEHMLSRLWLFSLVAIELTTSSELPPLQNPSNGLNVKSKQHQLPQCQLCRVLANSFNKGIDNTARGKFEGGDTVWEESRLGSYADSELRLVEIQEKLCSELDKEKDQCHSFAEQHEHLLEEWWFKKKLEIPDIHQFLCIDNLKVCCPENHFGAECKPCPGGVTNPCSGRGKCKGAGTRKGSGECKCNDGYTGELCNECQSGYYNETQETDWQCTKCHKSCKGYCRDGGPKGCEVCADGYQHMPDYGCTDIDECIELDHSPCKKNSFCANSEGSYHCMDCDKSCDECTGDGPDMCVKCASNYVLKDGLCIESGEWKRTLHVELARYATYLGLTIATFIIFKRNSILACIIGVVISIYIGVSEYALGEWDLKALSERLQSWLVL